MRPYLGPPWTDSCKIWCVRVFHYVLLKCSHENAEMQKWKFDDVTLRNSIQLKFCSQYCYPLISLKGVNWKFTIITTHTKENPPTTNCHSSFSKLVRLWQRKRLSKIWVIMSTNNIQIFQFKIEKTLAKTGTLNAGISPLIAKRNHLNIRHFPFLSDKSTQTEWSS